MSEEEKKAIDKINKLVEYLRKWNKNATIIPADIKYFEKILDVIKTYIRMIDENIEEILEQSKEIEELKEDNKKKSIVIIEYQDLYEKLVDKIKAKIEELDKQEKEVLKGTKGQDRYAIKQEYMHKRSVLQSLLEKE